MSHPLSPHESLTRDLACHGAFGQVGYVYGYPHKTAYRSLQTPRTPEDVWREESRDSLYCYVHVPFCSIRCSFCNLFTHVPGDDPADRYLDAVARQAEHYASVLTSARFAGLYIGGGTPTYLTAPQLRRLLRHLEETLAVHPGSLPSCIETSPETLDEEKVETLRELGFQRVSMGVQSFVPEELRHVNRRFDFACHQRAIDLLGRQGFPQVNLDLIYGLPGQTEASWRHSLECATATPATSLFLYPLYVRPLTGLDRHADLPPAPTPALMERLYDVGVEHLTRAGFRQRTMRQFRRGEEAINDTEYRCQRDGMLGLGAGARSYTRTLHYATPWKMLASNIRGVIDDYCRAWSDGDTLIRNGFVLNEDEQRRRFLILSLLYDGLDLEEFRTRFGADALEAYAPQWDALCKEECVTLDTRKVALTSRGLRHADSVGRLFFSGQVHHLMETFEYDP